MPRPKKVADLKVPTSSNSITQQIEDAIDVINKRTLKTQWKKSCIQFIQEAVKIEDRDEAVGPQAEEALLLEDGGTKEYTERTDGIAVPFVLWERQIEALQDFLKYKHICVLKARQLGLTWLALVYAVWRILFFSGYQVVALSKKETPDAKELIRRVRFILRHLPDWLIREHGSAAAKNWNGLTYEATVLSITIHHPDNEPSVLISMAATPDSGRSFTANLIILDEWAYQQYAEEIYTSAYATINRPSGGQVIGLSTGKRMTFFEKMCRMSRTGKNDFHFIFLPWDTDPRRTPEWYEETKRNLPNSFMSEYPATPEEAFSAGEDTAFPEFSLDIHVCDDFPGNKPPDHWRKWLCLDNGYDNPYYWGWLTVSEDGQIFLYQEYTRSSPEEPKVTYSEQGKRVMELCTKITLEDGYIVEEPDKFDYIVAGADAWAHHHRDASGKTLVDYYRDGGIIYGFREPITRRDLRKAVFHEYLKPYEDANTGKLTAKLQICKSCKRAIEIIPQLFKDPDDPEKVADTPWLDDAYDAIGYGILSYHVRKTKPKAVQKPPPPRQQTHIKMLERRRRPKARRYG